MNRTLRLSRSESGTATPLPSSSCALTWADTHRKQNTKQTPATIGGAVVAHSNSLVRGKERSIREPYTLAGVTGQGAVGRSVAFTKWMFGSVEGKLTALDPRADCRRTGHRSERRLSRPGRHWCQVLMKTRAG